MEFQLCQSIIVKMVVRLTSMVWATDFVQVLTYVTQWTHEIQICLVIDTENSKSVKKSEPIITTAHQSTGFHCLSSFYIIFLILVCIGFVFRKL